MCAYSDWLFNGPSFAIRPRFAIFMLMSHTGGTALVPDPTSAPACKIIFGPRRIFLNLE